MSRQVLLVDDDLDMRDAVKELLEEEGYEVHVADNGADALAKLPRLKRLCLAVVDLIMPVMDGLEFIRRLRAIGRTDIPVVVMSGYPTAAPVGAHVLEKPVQVPEFLHYVHQSCRSH